MARTAKIWPFKNLRKKDASAESYQPVECKKSFHLVFVFFTIDDGLIEPVPVDPVDPSEAEISRIRSA
jgi:hypothetical protein